MTVDIDTGGFITTEHHTLAR